MKDSFRIFFKRFISLFKTVHFWTITAMGNLVVLAFAYLFFHFEKGMNQNVLVYWDAVWWGFTTVTTVGYGDVTPVTFYGRLLGIALMVFGTGLFATYTAIFANVMVGNEFFSIGKKVSVIRKNVEGIQTNIHQEDLMLARELQKINKHLNNFNERLRKMEIKDKLGENK